MRRDSTRASARQVQAIDGLLAARNMSQRAGMAWAQRELGLRSPLGSLRSLSSHQAGVLLIRLEEQVRGVRLP
jgi:hypothetical protein